MKLIILLFFLSLPYIALAQEEPWRKSIAEIERSFDAGRDPDKACIDFKTKPCKPPLVGIIVSYWAPEFLMESVKAPGEYILEDQSSAQRQQKLIASARQGVADIARWHEDNVEEDSLEENILEDENIEPSSTSSYQSMDGGILQFNEVHIMPFKYGVLADLACLSASLPNVYSFMSEDIFKSWRTDTENIANRFMVDRLVMGSWGRLFPRTGFMIHPSTMTASVATCMKGVARAHPEFIDELLTFKDKVQLIYPEKSRCMPVGYDLRGLERGSYSSNGRYGWIYWHYRRCEYCVAP